MAVNATADWLSAKYGPADAGGRLPAKRRVRTQGGAELSLMPSVARALERDQNGGAAIEYVDGLPPESRLVRNSSARMGEVSENE